LLGLRLDSGELHAGDRAQVLLLEIELHQIHPIDLQRDLLDVAVLEGEIDRFAGLDHGDFIQRDAFLLEVGDGLGGVRIDFAHLGIPLDGVLGFALRMIDLAQDIAGQIPVLAVAIGHHLGRGQGLGVLVLPEPAQRGHVLEAGGKRAVRVFFGELIA